jgi:NIMA (never in mitosis gene a)-related kinase
MGQLSQKEKENAVNEARILASIKYGFHANIDSHPHIIAYKEAFFEDSTSSLCIVMEYAQGGDLMGKINTHIKNRTNFPEEQLWQIFIQMASGLKALHDLKILHRDMKVGRHQHFSRSVRTSSSRRTGR